MRFFGYGNFHFSKTWRANYHTLSPPLTQMLLFFARELLRLIGEMNNTSKCYKACNLEALMKARTRV
jgi:hypothetical protein